MQAGGALGTPAASPKFSSDIVNVISGKIRMVEKDRPIDQADPDLGSAACAGHQRREINNIQRVHNKCLPS
jgi:hypothetical protein